MRFSWKTAAIGAGIALVAFFAVLWGLEFFGRSAHRPAVTSVPPLAPVTRSSVVVTPVAITLNAIRDSLEANAPREFAGKAEMPPLPVLGKADFGWSVNRGAVAIAAAPERLSVSAPLSGSFRASGQFGGGDMRDLSSGISNLISGFLGGSSAPRPSEPGRQPENLEQRADIRGSATVNARPQLMGGWRIDPNLEAQVTLDNASLSVTGMQLSIPDAVKPMVERALNEQVALLQSRLISDPFIELAARREWARACRSISLSAAAPPGMPNLWLEVRPVRAFAAQPRIGESAVTLTLGMQAETRILPNETKPDCPFPEQLEIVREVDEGRFSLAVPIDVPFTEASRTLTSQVQGKVFPDDRTSAFTATVKNVEIAASGDRLLIAVGLRANENKSWFGFGANATIYLWGRPALDPERQVLRLNDIKLDVQSEAVFGMLGIAARAAVPYLEKLLVENAAIEIAPIATIARQSIDAAVTEFRQRSDGIRVDARVNDLRLADLEYDAKTLRVIAEANGTVRAEIAKIPQQ